MDSPRYQLVGRLNATVRTMRDNNADADEIKKGERLINELKTAHSEAQKKMERRRNLLPPQGRTGQPLDKWSDDEDYQDKVKTVNEFIERNRRPLEDASSDTSSVGGRRTKKRGARKHKKAKKSKKTKKRGHKKRRHKKGGRVPEDDFVPQMGEDDDDSGSMDDGVPDGTESPDGPKGYYAPQLREMIVRVGLDPEIKELARVYVNQSPEWFDSNYEEVDLFVKQYEQPLSPQQDGGSKRKKTRKHKRKGKGRKSKRR